MSTKLADEMWLLSGCSLAVTLAAGPARTLPCAFTCIPSVQASLAEDERAALLRLPSGMLWRLRAAGTEVSLGESAYLGSGEARKTQQVVLSGTVGPEGAAVRWALRLETKKGSTTSARH